MLRRLWQVASGFALANASARRRGKSAIAASGGGKPSVSGDSIGDFLRLPASSGSAARSTSKSGVAFPAAIFQSAWRQPSAGPAAWHSPIWSSAAFSTEINASQRLAYSAAGEPAAFRGRTAIPGGQPSALNTATDFCIERCQRAGAASVSAVRLDRNTSATASKLGLSLGV
jgi:hypothetical protein